MSAADRVLWPWVKLVGLLGVVVAVILLMLWALALWINLTVFAG